MEGLKPGVFPSLKRHKSLEAETRAVQRFDGSIREAKFLFNRLFSLSEIRALAFPLAHPWQGPADCSSSTHVIFNDVL